MILGDLFGANTAHPLRFPLPPLERCGTRLTRTGLLIEVTKSQSENILELMASAYVMPSISCVHKFRSKGE